VHSILFQHSYKFIHRKPNHLPYSLNKTTMGRVKKGMRENIKKLDKEIDLKARTVKQNQSI
jgi:hypothetical protein